MATATPTCTSMNSRRQTTRFMHRCEARPRLTRHSHLQRNGSGAPHGHWHDHLPATAHPIAAERMFKPPPLHEHGHKTSARTALILIRGSSPMVEGTPAFFAAGSMGWASLS